MLVQQHLTRGHLVTQSVGYKYTLDHKRRVINLVQARSGPDTAGRRYWARQLPLPGAEGLYIAAQLSLTRPAFAEPDCAFLHESYCLR